MIKITDNEFNDFSRYVQANYGIFFKNEKKTLIQGRLSQVIRDLKFKSLSEYLNYVKSDTTGEASVVLLNRITTNHTFFMREPAHFYYFRDKVLPFLVSTVRSKDLRIWSAASSTGEEAYTLAMLIDEYFGPSKGDWDTKILATDISADVIETAKRGIYSKDKIEALPESWQRIHFRKYDDRNYMISDKMKNEVIFNRLNLMDEKFPFRRDMHVIFCRNVMIYFDNDTKNDLAERLYDITAPGGFLFVGHSENLERNKTRYKYIMPSIYRKE